MPRTDAAAHRAEIPRGWPWPLAALRCAASGPHVGGEDDDDDDAEQQQQQQQQSDGVRSRRRLQATRSENALRNVPFLRRAPQTLHRVKSIRSQGLNEKYCRSQIESRARRIPGSPRLVSLCIPIIYIEYPSAPPPLPGGEWAWVREHSG
eukprot:scaffold910_cov396-Prasinococcus_capsulatus_cf.AAC.10